MQEQQHQGGIRHDVNRVISLMQCLAYVGEIWLVWPGTAGSRYFFSPHVFCGWFFLLVAAAFGQSALLMQFCWATAGWLLVQNLAHIVRSVRGYRPHSLFIGFRILSVLGGPYIAYRVWEPLCVFLLGVYLLKIGYGGFFCWVGIAMFFAASFAAAELNSRVRQMNDARRDQEWMMQHMDEN